MKKIKLIILWVLIINLLAGCGLFSVSQNEESSSDPTGQETELSPESKIDTGTYQGQVDNNFIEIAVSGVPEENSMRVFMLSDEIKERFSEMNISSGQVVKLQYFINENEQSVIVEIEKI